MIGKEQLLGIGNTILGSSTSDVVRVQIDYATRAVTRIANNRVLTSDNGESINVSIQTVKGGRTPISITLNMIDESSIKSIVKMMDNLARVQVGSPDDYTRVLDGPQNYLPVSLWYNSTIQALPVVNTTIIPELINTLRSSGLNGSGFVGLVASSTVAMQKDGLVAFHQETDSEITVSARTSDGKASGWYGQAARDWSKITPDVIAAKAIEIAKRGMNPYAVEPGRKTAILSPFAVAQILRYMASQFDAYMTNEMKATAFSVRGDPKRDNKMGFRVLDHMIRISSDPADPDGGYIPFGDTESDGIALPAQPKVYVENGILTDLAYNGTYGLTRGKPFSQNPWSMRFEAVNGVPLKTVEEMISSCQDGIYINRFSDVSQLDSISGMQTGVTRDGCFLIKNGKIDRSVKNFRFTDSPFFFFNNIIAIGKSERTAIGYTNPSQQEPSYASRWPRRPIIAPAVMVRDFSLTALSDSV